ncbi:MAG: FHA domain-containing protein [Alphaproteobacteria bacterium]|nr:FHA domain-containing protein [Alphaproteobacteria bacterium]MCB9696527.1 FHA domain-containing protein [Alphaproteobacteria bacterium]
MDKAELLRTFTDRVNQFEKYQGFIAKAKDQSRKFAAAVVGKVIKDNEEKCREVASEIMPLVSQIEQVIGELQTSRDKALDSAKESQFKLEEFELRLAIGDLSQADFEAESSEFKSVVDTTDARVADLDNERTRFQEALGLWNRLAEESGYDDGVGPAPGPEIDVEEPEIGFDDSEPVDESLGADDDDDDNFSATPAPAATPMMAERHRAPEPEPEVLIDDEPVDIAEPDSDVVFEEARGDGFEVDDLDLLGDEEDIQLDEGAGKEEKPRRAVLLYQEGTAEEQIYPFTGEILSLGRGRDNDVQVKNDSKVSRYHCKLYRRGPNFYIEDNKSANGTLVNGELITERRLFGGEEVIIGETFFRFRILD